MTGLHTFLQEYERKYPSEILHIEQEINAKFQVTELIRRLEQKHKFPALVLHNVIREGNRCPFPVVTFLMSSRERIARMLGTSADRAGVAFFQRLNHKLAPVVVARGEAPVKEVVSKGEEVDLNQIPALWHHELDPGYYTTAGFLTLRNPETNLENSAIHRGWLSGKREVRIELGPSSHNAHIIGLYQAQQQDIPVAIWIGHHPLAVLGAEARVSIMDSHFAAAGGVLGEPLRLVPSETLGNDFLVPADAEIVIEGYIPHGRTKPEGPFGEYTRYFGAHRPDNPFIEVTAVTRRQTPYWMDIMVGHTHWVSSLQKEGAAYYSVKGQVPSLVNVHMPMSGCGASHLYLQLKSPTREMARTAIIAAFNAHHTIRHVFALDEDINIFNDQEVLWALATRFSGDRDLIVLPDLLSSPLDPCDHGPRGTKVGFDCTRGRNDFPQRVSIPPEVSMGFNLDDYISPADLSSIPTEG